MDEKADVDEPVDQPRGLRRFNKRMFFFFGPPQLGRGGEPAPAVDRDPVCPHCGERESRHTIFRDASKSFAQCPDRVGPSGK